jgi:hypothetical protein
MTSIEQLQKQLQEEIRVKDEIVEKTQKLLLSKRQLKEQYDQVVTERNALQVKLSANEKVDMVKMLQDKLAKLTSGSPNEGSDGASGPLAKQVEQLKEQNLRLETQLKEARLAVGEKPGLVPGKPNPNEQYYVISASDAENLTRRIKKLQTELWNLEIKHQQLQESNAKQSTLLRPEIKSDDASDLESLKEALKREREFGILVINRHKELTEAIVELKEDLKLALEQSPNDPLLNAVNKLAQKALLSSESVLLSPPEFKKDGKDKDEGGASPSAARLSFSTGRPSRSSKNAQDLDARPASPSPLLSPAAALKEKEKRENKEKRSSQVLKKSDKDREKDKDKDKDKDRDRKSKAATKV